MEHTKNDRQHIATELEPAKGAYALATLGSKTRLGGEIITASTATIVDGHRIACVGDVVRYADRPDSMIVSGAGFALTFGGQPMAIVGSATDNGDTIISSPQDSAQILKYDNDIPGLLEPGYLAPENRT